MKIAFTVNVLAFEALSRVACYGLGLGVSLLFCCSEMALAQKRADSSKVAQEIRTLVLGKPIERELTVDEVHAYQVTLAAGQYMHMIIEQRGIDVAVTFYGPDGKYLSKSDFRELELEPVSLVVHSSGVYRLELSIFGKEALSGRYKISITELREKTPLDEIRVAAECASTVGKYLLKSGEAGAMDSLRKAVGKCEEALQLWRTVGDNFGEAQALNHLGYLYSMLGEQQKALKYVELALKLRENFDDPFGKAETFANLGGIHSALGDKKKALEYYSEGLPLWKRVGSRRGEALLLNNIGAVYWAIGQPQKAIDHLNQALPLWQMVNDRSGEATTLNTMGMFYALLGEKQKALENFNRALPLLRSTGDRREAYTLVNLGWLSHQSGNMREALDYYNQALPLMREMEDRRGESMVLNNIGNLYTSTNENQKALEYFDQALKLLYAAGDRFQASQVLANMAPIFDLLGDKQKAIESNNQALQLMREVANRRGEANTLSNLGILYGSLGQTQRALDFLNQALPLTREVGDRHTETLVLLNMGGLYSNRGEYQKALEYFNQALPQSRAIENHYNEILALHNIGNAYYFLGDMQKALDYLNQSMMLRQTVGERRGEANTLYQIGWVYHDMGEKEKALNYFTQTLQLCRKIGDQRNEAYSLLSLASIARDRDDLTNARTYVESAIGIVDSLRTKVASRDLRVSYLASVWGFYEFYIDLLMRLHQRQSSESYDLLALQTNERASARSLLEFLSEAHVDIRQGIDSVLVERERKLQQQLNAKAERLSRLYDNQLTNEQVAVLDKDIRELTTQLYEVEGQIRATNSRYAAFTQFQPLTITEIQEQVLDDETMLLEYSLGEARSFLWAVTPISINSFELPKRAEIDSLARRFYDLLTVRNQDFPEEQMEAQIAQTDQELPKVAATLSHILLGPVAELLGNKRMLIVSDGALQYIPFGALPVPVINNQLSVSSERPLKTDHWSLFTDYRPLVVEHEIITLPSASVLAVLRRELAERKSAAKAVAVLADPVFSRDDPRVKPSKTAMKKQTQADTTHTDAGAKLASALNRSARETGIIDSTTGFGRLIYSRREAKDIVNLVAAGEGKRAVDFDANRETATSAELSQYRMVHFATHGLLNSTHPELSGIVLSLVNEKGEEQDGFLRLHEIYNLNLPAELVVLSACQTALGKEIKGEGLVGLTRGFMYAGAARVVASLWSVPDESTAEMMKRFYAKMLGKEQMRPVAALRAAQIEMWQTKRWNAPYYWAAFVIQGEWK